jgi:hypothetical protein
MEVISLFITWLGYRLYGLCYLLFFHCSGHKGLTISTGGETRCHTSWG